MPEPIGSVYLDAPRPARARPSGKRGRRAVAAGYLGLIGILGLTLAGLLAGVRAAVAEPDPLVTAVTGAFDDPEARAEIESEVAEAIQTKMLGPGLLDAAATYGIDHEAEIETWTAAVLDDPEFSEAVGELIVDVHSHVFVDPTPEPIDTSRITEIVIGAAEESAPTLVPLLPANAELITIDPSGLPDLTRPMTELDRAILIALAAGAGLPLALLVHDRRHRVISWVGRWMIAAGLVLGLASIGLPHVAGQVTGWVTAETAVRTASIRLLAPAGIAGGIGMSLASVAAVWRRRERRKVAREGAAAWLEVIEPAPWVPPPSPSMELARRGLVDGSRQLTNI